MKMDQTECSETLEFKLQTPGTNLEESIRRSKHGESLKSWKHIIGRTGIVSVLLENEAATLLVTLEANLRFIFRLPGLRHCVVC
jgi:hypothetical protein